jgi:L-fucose mutarotase
MLKTKLLHPEILQALGSAGHGEKVLIADGNYQFWSATHPLTKRVYLNFSPGKLSVTDVLSVLVDFIPIEKAEVMTPAEGQDPDIFAEFRQILDNNPPLTVHDRFSFYEEARKPQTALLIATGEQRVYANLLLTIGVVKPE